ncbi:probable mannosyltransferase Ktr5p [Diutina catenulata]
MFAIRTPATKRRVLIFILTLLALCGVMVATRPRGPPPINRRPIRSRSDFVFSKGCRPVVDAGGERKNAALVMLARNSDVEGVVSSVKSLETHFNQWFNYPWVFLNDEPFTPEFQLEVRKYTKNAIFDIIPQEDWEFPKEVRPLEANEWMDQQGDRGILYGNLPSYHKMCRFYSNKFYHHPQVAKLDWYWRVEPDVTFFCDITYDPFVEMENNGKKYGFNVFIPDLYYSLPGLFREVNHFIRKNNIKPRDERTWGLFMEDRLRMESKNYDVGDFNGSYSDVVRSLRNRIIYKRFAAIPNKSNELMGQFAPLIEWMSGETRRKRPLYEDRLDQWDYNWFHFWTNFEIARVDLFTSEFYQKYFDHLDKSGGFFKERWGDAPVRSLALGLMTTIDEIHYFRDIGYKHSELAHCPFNGDENDGDDSRVGCRCKCPRNANLETKSSIERWARNSADGYRVPNFLDLDKLAQSIERDIDAELKSGKHLHELVQT